MCIVEMEGHVFKNWAETYSCQPELYFEPRDLQELRQVHVYHFNRLENLILVIRY